MTKQGRLKIDAKKKLIETLILYRESARNARRYQLSAWADRKLQELAAQRHVGEDLKVQDAIAEYHGSLGDSERAIAVELLRDFRCTLTDIELDALLEATK